MFFLSRGLTSFQPPHLEHSFQQHWTTHFSLKRAFNWYSSGALFINTPLCLQSQRVLYYTFLSLSSVLLPGDWFSLH